MLRIRKPAVAGQFYSGNPDTLRRDVESFILEATTPNGAPKAMIAPHAGYVFSGPVAGRVYARLKPVADTIKNVVLLGPAHRVHFYGIATLSHDAWSTPLGNVPIAQDLIDDLEKFNTVLRLDRAHEGEHSLEVHLPFLQVLLKDFSILPLLVGDTTCELVAEVMNAVWGGPETLLVVSSDLSHFLDYESAFQKDKETSAAILSLNDSILTPDRACGCLPISALLRVAQKKGLHAEMVDLRNSGDTAGSKNKVVGYGAYAFN